MNPFPRTTVGGVSLSRMIIGTNWFLGYSHTSKAKNTYIIDNISDRNRMADILEVFLEAGIDTIMGPTTRPALGEGIQEAQQRTGKKLIVIATPGFGVGPTTPEAGVDPAAAKQALDESEALNATFCMPHQSTTDKLVDRCTRTIRRMDEICAMIRDRGMIPGLSTHMPESIVYADETGLDVETYISMYNSMGFLMQVEVDWVCRIIRDAKKPVMTIKPFASGQLRPFQALHFVWNTLRDCDMVTVGTMSPGEAAEVVELSMSILEKRQADVALQETRSKDSVKPAET